MFPEPWEFVLLALGTFRLTRLLGWDAFPPIRKLRDRITGAEWHWNKEGLEQKRGETATEVAGTWTFRRPVIAELVDCPFCLGLWLSGGVFLLWWAFGDPMLAAMTPFAISGVVGVIAKNAG